ncbi:hypothetical protein [Lysinibacillus xylanilyticus]|uniref:Exosporium leader peptide n=1 Tax=Lysinibacillus xylanilyticus TaxID=582475 RepID=A0ABV3W198_9BACI
MNSNNNGCHQSGCTCQRCNNGKFNCTGVRPFRAIDASCIPEPPKEETVAYGSFYNPTEDNVVVTPITPPNLGQKVIFTTPGPSLNVDPAPFPNNTTDLQVATSGIYEISMDISVSLNASSNLTPIRGVRFGLYINDSNLAIGSIFESTLGISASTGDQFVTSNMLNTVGRTIQLRLNKDDRLSIRVLRETGNDTSFILYRFPSLVVNKIAN